jgi:hypothetical protein
MFNNSWKKNRGECEQNLSAIRATFYFSWKDFVLHPAKEHLKISA